MAVRWSSHIAGSSGGVAHSVALPATKLVLIGGAVWWAQSRGTAVSFGDAVDQTARSLSDVHAEDHAGHDHSSHRLSADQHEDCVTHAHEHSARSAHSDGQDYDETASLTPTPQAVQNLGLNG